MKYSNITSFFIVTVVLLFFSITDANAQEKESRKEKKRTQAETDNSFAPAGPEMTYDPEYSQKKTRKKKKWAFWKKKKSSYRYDFVNSLDQKKEEFYKRIKRNAKEDRKMAKKMEKPQYSDPTYFGHKRKPKKRPVGKRKYCKECGIVH